RTAPHACVAGGRLDASGGWARQAPRPQGGVARRCDAMSESRPERRDPDARTAELIARADLETARRAIEGVAVRTPLLACEELGEMTGTSVLIKAESLQRSGSFKLRGALAKVAALGARSADGLVTASAGNHARAVALAAGSQDIGCDVFMPLDAA